MTRTFTTTAIAAALALGLAHPVMSQGGPVQVDRLLNEADQAMQRNDPQAARQALQQARRAMESEAPPELQGDPMEFLRLAQRAIDQGAYRTAWIALGRAETRLLTRAVPVGSEGAAQGGAVGAIRSARQALVERDIDLANERTERAMVLARRDLAMGANASGAALTGAGTPGPGQPLTGGGTGGQAR